MYINIKATVNISQITNGHGFLSRQNPQDYTTPPKGTPVSTLNGPLATLMLTDAHIIFASAEAESPVIVPSSSPFDSPLHCICHFSISPMSLGNPNPCS